MLMMAAELVLLFAELVMDVPVPIWGQVFNVHLVSVVLCQFITLSYTPLLPGKVLWGTTRHHWQKQKQLQI